ncbi:MAG TPA: hypothetical protein PK765_03180 [bacterium]|nr:hypothetical protein [bacterium]
MSFFDSFSSRHVVLCCLAALLFCGWSGFVYAEESRSVVQSDPSVVSDRIHFSVDMPSDRIVRFSWSAQDSRLVRDAAWFKLIYADEYDV